MRFVEPLRAGVLLSLSQLYKRLRVSKNAMQKLGAVQIQDYCGERVPGLGAGKDTLMRSIKSRKSYPA